jgi:hypothetical protein
VVSLKILFYTDLHAADQTPRSRTGSYREDILQKLHEIVHLAQQHDVDWLVNGADTFHQKSSWRTSHSLVQDMIQIMRPFPGDRHLTMLGTHDVPTGRLDKLPQQPLGVLAKAGVMRVFTHPTVYKPNDEVWFHFVPASYNLDKDPSNYAFDASEDVPPPGCTVVTVAHGMVVPPGQTFYGDFTVADTIKTDAKLFLYGHPHTPDGTYVVNNTVFVGPGSVARLGVYPYNRDRVPTPTTRGVLTIYSLRSELLTQLNLSSFSANRSSLRRCADEPPTANSRAGPTSGGSPPLSWQVQRRKAVLVVLQQLPDLSTALPHDGCSSEDSPRQGYLLRYQRVCCSLPLRGLHRWDPSRTHGLEGP